MIAALKNTRPQVVRPEQKQSASSRVNSRRRISRATTATKHTAGSEKQMASSQPGSTRWVTADQKTSNEMLFCGMAAYLGSVQYWRK